MGSPIVEFVNCTIKCDICGRELSSWDAEYRDGDVVLKCCDVEVDEPYWKKEGLELLDVLSKDEKEAMIKVVETHCRAITILQVAKDVNVNKFEDHDEKWIQWACDLVVKEYSTTVVKKLVYGDWELLEHCVELKSGYKVLFEFVD